jgi:hypothetical protein
MTEVPDFIKEQIYQRIKNDMQPPAWLVHTKVGASIAIGGFLSLFLCGQMGIGLSSLAHQVHAILMDFGGVWGCTAICGALFALVPALFLRLISSAMQYRIILKKKRPEIAGWIVAAGTVIVLQNGYTEALLPLTMWSIPAIATSLICGWLISRLSSLSLRQNLINFS